MAGEVLVDRRVLPGHADQLADHVRAARRTSTPKICASPPSIGSSVASMPEHGGLARAVRAEHAEDLAAADLEVDAVDRALLAEGLDQAGGGDGQVGVGNSCHAGKRAGPRFHPAFTPVSRPR